MPVLSISLDIPDNIRAEAIFGLRELFHRIGFGIRLTTDGSGDVLYTTVPNGNSARFAATIPCNPKLYEPPTKCLIRNVNGWKLWTQAQETTALPDIVGGAYRLLTYQDEYFISDAQRDRRGVFETAALPEERRRIAAEPVVEYHAGYLRQLISAVMPRRLEAAAPRWPGQKRYAVTVTHDVDHVHLGAPLELLTCLAKAALRGDAAEWQQFRMGLDHIFGPRGNPYDQFNWWQRWERASGIRSAFYMFVRPDGVSFDVNDCKSTVAGTDVDWQLFRGMSEDGWEFGLHASIRTKENADGFLTAREWLERRLNTKVLGVRHHYFALDWRQPYLTHRAHASAGFHYDTSIAWRDVAGFRTGTSLPHSAFDPLARHALDFTIIPCNLMDSHIACLDVRGKRVHMEDALAMGRDIIDLVKKQGGIVVINWHQEAAFNRFSFDGYRDLFEAVATTCINDSTAWVATPMEICRHWNRMVAGLYRE